MARAQTSKVQNLSFSIVNALWLMASQEDGKIKNNKPSRPFLMQAKLSTNRHEIIFIALNVLEFEHSCDCTYVNCFQENQQHIALNENTTTAINQINKDFRSHVFTSVSYERI